VISQFLSQFLGSHSAVDEYLSVLRFYAPLIGKQVLVDTYNILKKLEFPVLLSLFYHKESCAIIRCQDFLIISEPLQQRSLGSTLGT
jgi:hypothetical protein